MKLKEHSKCGKIAKCTDIYIYIYILFELDNEKYGEKEGWQPNKHLQN
jgi:hypothetical protein